jgi:hypothetical protein
VFYVLLLTLIITLDDRFRPVSQVRFTATADRAAVSGT